MQSPFRPRNWVIFILINILVSAVTTVVVVRALTQAASRPTAVQPEPTHIAAQAVAPASARSDSQALASALPTPAAPAESPPALAEALAQPTTAPEMTAEPQRTTLATAAPQAAEQASVRISTVVYPGQRSREAVVIVNEGDQVDMTSWTLANPRGKIYTFGNVVLFKDSFINLHTTTGADVPTDLFWNLEEPAWQKGDVATLKRGDEVMATFTVK